MSPRTQQVLRDALQLPPKARADIAGTLLHSLDTTEDRGVEEAWAVEVERRIAEVEAGGVRLVSWDRVRKRLRARLHGGRAKG